MSIDSINVACGYEYRTALQTYTIKSDIEIKQSMYIEHIDIRNLIPCQDVNSYVRKTRQQWIIEGLVSLNSLLLLNLDTLKTIPRAGKVVVSHRTGRIALDKLSTNYLFDPYDPFALYIHRIERVFYHLKCQ